MLLRRDLTFTAAVLALAAYPLGVRAHEPHVCPPDLPDTPAFTGHIEQDDIVAGAFRLSELFDIGQALFVAVFNVCDGQGRPASTGTGAPRVPDQPAFIRTSSPDSNACAGCHAQPRAGGGGDFVANVFVLAQALDPVTFSVGPEDSNERNTLGMFGSGAIEMLAREMSTELLAIQDAAVADAVAGDSPVTSDLIAKGVDFGDITGMPDGSVDVSAVKGIDADLVIKPFHQAGVVTSLRQFTDNAFNHHHGMQATERFGPDPDADLDGVEDELSVGDITAVTLFQAALGVPGRMLPADPSARAKVNHGEMLFADIGCAGCHTPELILDSRDFVEPSPFNPEGTFADTSQSFSFDMTKKGEMPRLEKAKGGGAIVRAYTDLKRHNLCDEETDFDSIRFFCNELLDQGRPEEDGHPGAEFFITRKLWDVGNSAPYGHRGDLTTIAEAILMHAGQARPSRDAFAGLLIEAQKDIVNFLKTLQVLPPNSPRVVVAN